MPVALVAAAPELLVANPAAPFDDFAGFVAYAKTHPNQLNYSHAGNGTLPHVTMELLLRRVGVEVRGGLQGRGAGHDRPVRRRGAAQARYLRDLRPAARRQTPQGAGGGQQDPHGPIARVPTVAESGLPGYEGSLWMGVMAPAGTPAAIIERVSRAFIDAVHAPELRARLTGDGVEIIGADAGAFGAQIRAELRQWRELVRAAGITERIKTTGRPPCLI